MSSVSPRTTYKVRAFILSFHFERGKKWTTYYDCLLLEILVLVWCEFFFFLFDDIDILDENCSTEK